MTVFRAGQSDVIEVVYFDNTKMDKESYILNKDLEIVTQSISNRHIISFDSPLDIEIPLFAKKIGSRVFLVGQDLQGVRQVVNTWINKDNYMLLELGYKEQGQVWIREDRYENDTFDFTYFQSETLKFTSISSPNLTFSSLNINVEDKKKVQK